MKPLKDLLIGIYAALWYHRKPLLMISALLAAVWFGALLMLDQVEAIEADHVITVDLHDHEIAELHEIQEITNEIVESQFDIIEIQELEIQELAAVNEQLVNAKWSEFRRETYELTAYCSCPICCGKWSGGPTKSGTMPVAGRTIAVDPKKIPLGSTVYIEGLGVFIAEDTGSAINDKIIDIYFDDHEEAKKFGRQEAIIVVLKIGGTK